MDPYRILGVPRGCTRQEAKDAFRAKAWQVHPDRGGDERAFIELDAAYRRILRELEFVPGDWRGGSGSKAGHDAKPSPQSFDTIWEPEIIVLGDPAPVSRPARPPDPDWEPEMVLLGDPPRPQRPFDPSFEPEMVVLDEPPCRASPPDQNRAANSSYPWLWMVSSGDDGENTPAGAACFRGVLATVLVILFVVLLLKLMVTH